MKQPRNRPSSLPGSLAPVREGDTAARTTPVARSAPVPTAGKAVAKPAAKPAAGGKTPAKLPISTDILMTSLNEGMRKELGHSAVPTAEGIAQMSAVVPCPLLCEYMYGISGMPVGRIIEVSAVTGVGKTAFLAEMIRWFQRHEGGIGGLVENEHRLDVDWIYAFANRPVHITRSNTIDECEQQLIMSMQRYQDVLYKDSVARGRTGRRARIHTPPFLLGADSIMGHQAEEIMAKIIGSVDAKTGLRTGGGEAVGRAYALEAGKLAKFSRSIPTLMDLWPITLVLVNQLRLQKKDGDYQATKVKAGGEQLNFAKNYEIELYKGAPVRTADMEGHRVTMKLGKSSGASENRQITVRLYWWYEADPTDPTKVVKRGMWDWDWALVNFILLGLHETHARWSYIRPRLKEAGIHVEATKTGDAQNMAYSKMLGMKKEHAITWAELGRKMVETPEILAKLRFALGILERPIVTTDYRGQLDDMARKLE